MQNKALSRPLLMLASKLYLEDTAMVIVDYGNRITFQILRRRDRGFDFSARELNIAKQGDDEQMQASSGG